MSRHCPEKRKAPGAVRAVGEQPAESQEESYFGCVTVAKTKPRPRGATVSDFITKKSFAHKNSFEALDAG